MSAVPPFLKLEVKERRKSRPELLLLLAVFSLCVGPGVAQSSDDVEIVGGGISGGSGAGKPQSAYKWKVGPWGSCHSHSKCGEGQQHRSVWCAHLDDRTSLKVLCDAAGRVPDGVRDCFQVCDEHRGHLSWRVGPWGACLPAPASRPDRLIRIHSSPPPSPPLLLPPPPPPPQRIDHAASIGRMSRDVVCVYRRSNHSQARQVSDEACSHFESKPVERLPCTVPRADDCVVTEYGDWMACRGGCQAELASSNRTRARQVLVAPSNGGRACPRISETEPCGSSDDLNRHDEAMACLQQSSAAGLGLVRAFRLRIGLWSDCFGLDGNGVDDPSSQFGFWPSVGYQTRDVSCKDEAGRPVELSHCLGEEDPQVPPRVMACIVPVDCLVSSWSEWTVQKEGCVTQSGHVHAEVRTRVRQVLRLRLGSGTRCPHLKETHRIEDKGRLPPCTKYKWSPAEWSDCVLTEQSVVRKVLCGGGIRRRNITCLNSEDLVPVSPSLCVELPPNIIQRCSIPCRQDCRVSAWSTWGPCKPLDCKDFFFKKLDGYQERSRSVVSAAAGATEDECGLLRQVDACDDPSCYQWKTTEFSSCVVLNKELKCGQGKQSRNAFCVDLDGVVMDDGLCRVAIAIPEQTVPCYVPCPNDCILSSWSSWSACSRICTEKNDYGHRTRNRTILAPSGLGGTPCPSPSELAETEVCNQHSCTGFGWKVFPWQRCRVVSVGIGGTSYISEMCGAGQQVRDVHCVKDDEKRVHDRKCQPLPRPLERRNCTVPCPRDCILSKFSDWTPCKDVCRPGEAAELQERVRYVLQWPEAGRPPCSGSLKETRPCPSSCSSQAICSRPCNTYAWSTREWGFCILPDNTECGMGYRTRGLSCVRQDGEEVEISLCLQRNLTAPPKTVQPCHVDCDHLCVFSEWGTWSSCPMSCGGTQVRTRVQLGDGPHMAECRNVQRHPLSEERGCPCRAHSVLAEGDHSDCLLDDDATDQLTSVNGRDARGRCGVGRKLRRVACYDKNNQLMDPFLCTSTGYEDSSCMVACPVDCQMSSWSDWSTCSSVCGQGVQHRTRRVLREDYDNGRPCPPVDTTQTQREARLCSVSCRRYQWKTYEWTPCEMSRRDVANQHCGPGSQTRKVRCVKVDDNDNNRHDAAREEFCDPVLKPPDMNQCHIPCPSDCVVSDWAPWSTCSQPCDGTQVRLRRRYMERKPLVMGHACPLLDEKGLCTLNTNCFHYMWNLTEWTLCTIPDGATCGEGVKQRGVVCLRSDGRAVPDEFCREKNVSKPEQSELPCMVDCPIDCEVSEWSDWNDEACHSCEESTESRTSVFVARVRRVIVSPSPMGRPCPDDLVQRKPCPALPCYRWHHSTWSECELEGGQCGHGRRRREVSCRRADGTLVERRYCLESNSTTDLMRSLTDMEWIETLLNIHEEEPCFVSCPGDCIVSEWTEWSPCHRDCIGGEQVGVQSRSRAVEVFPSTHGEPCPKQMWETKPCLGGPCLTYNWQVRPGSVVCVRSDGLLVIGGCHGKARPCVPACRLLHSQCGHGGECECRRGYRPVFRMPSIRSGSTSSSTSGFIVEGPSNAALRHRELLACEPLVALTNSSHHTQGSTDGAAGIGEGSGVTVDLYPNANEVSFWMYAMIAVASAFVIFVAVTVYLMCHTSVGGRAVINGGPDGGLGLACPLQHQGGNPQVARRTICKEQQAMKV